MSTAPDDIAAGAPAGSRSASPAQDPAFETSLPQAEIDVLTGFTPSPAPSVGGGVRGMLDGPAASREVLPMLGIVVDRFAVAAAVTLAGILGPGASVSLRDLRPDRYGRLLDALEMPTQFFVLKAEGWDGPALMTVGPGVVYGLLDRLLGAPGGLVPLGFDDRPPTGIELAILRKVVIALLRDAGESFGTVSPVTFTIDRLETDGREVGLAEPGEAVVSAAFDLDLDGRTGAIGLVVPFSALSPIRDRLAESYMGEAAGSEAVWSNHFATELWDAPIAAQAVLHETRLPLGRILDLAVGDTLMFDRKPSDLVTVRCGDVVLTRGRIGRVDGRIAVQVVEALHPPPARAAHGRIGR